MRFASDLLSTIAIITIQILTLKPNNLKAYLLTKSIETDRSKYCHLMKITTDEEHCVLFDIAHSSVALRYLLTYFIKIFF